MPKQSAGLLVYRVRDDVVEVFLVHPGGPFWAKKDAGAWSIPKGEFEAGEEALTAAQREFTEETGIVVTGPFAGLGSIRQSGGKTIHAFVAEADFDAARIVSNTFPLEWPKGSGTIQDFPEIDDARWVSEAEARNKLVKGQLPILDALVKALLQRQDHP